MGIVAWNRWIGNETVFDGVYFFHKRCDPDAHASTVEIATAIESADALVHYQVELFTALVASTDKQLRDHLSSLAFAMGRLIRLASEAAGVEDLPSPEAIAEVLERLSSVKQKARRAA
jgi:hypothetical protein